MKIFTSLIPSAPLSSGGNNAPVDGQAGETPLPNSLDPETQSQLREIRKQLWFGSLKGLVAGIMLGIGVYKLVPAVPQLKKYHKWFRNRNRMVFTAFTCGACCSYLGAVVHGKNAFVLSNLFQFFSAGKALGVSPPTSTVSSLAPTANATVEPHNNGDSDDRIDTSPSSSPQVSYQNQIRENTQNILAHNADEAFHRRAEAIRKAKEAQQKKQYAAESPFTSFDSPRTDNNSSKRW